MPQNEHIELHQKRYGRRLDAEEKERKKEARAPKRRAHLARSLKGLRGKQYAEKRHKDKIEMKKTEKRAKESDVKEKTSESMEGALPAYLLDRNETERAKVLSNTVKQKRKEKAGRWQVPIQKARPIAEEEMFTALRTGKKKSKSWKRRISKATFVGNQFTRKPPKYERFIRPSGLRFTSAHVSHPELKATFSLSIIGVKKNPNGPMYSQLGVLTKGCIVEVNVSDLGLVTPSGQIIYAKYAQITNCPENDGCVNAVLLV